MAGLFEDDDIDERPAKRKRRREPTDPEMPQFFDEPEEEENDDSYDADHHAWQYAHDYDRETPEGDARYTYGIKWKPGEPPPAGFTVWKGFLHPELKFAQGSGMPADRYTSGEAPDKEWAADPARTTAELELAYTLRPTWAPARVLKYYTPDKGDPWAGGHPMTFHQLAESIAADLHKPDCHRDRDHIQGKISSAIDRLNDSQVMLICLDRGRTHKLTLPRRFFGPAPLEYLCRLYLKYALQQLFWFMRKPTDYVYERAEGPQGKIKRSRIKEDHIYWNALDYDMLLSFARPRYEADVAKAGLKADRQRIAHTFAKKVFDGLPRTYPPELISTIDLTRLRIPDPDEEYRDEIDEEERVHDRSPDYDPAVERECTKHLLDMRNGKWRRRHNSIEDHIRFHLETLLAYELCTNRH